VRLCFQNKTEESRSSLHFVTKTNVRCKTENFAVFFITANILHRHHLWGGREGDYYDDFIVLSLSLLYKRGKKGTEMLFLHKQRRFSVASDVNNLICFIIRPRLWCRVYPASRPFRKAWFHPNFVGSSPWPCFSTKTLTLDRAS